MNIFEMKAKDYLGKDVDLSFYKGHVVLVVNTATKCIFTKQYKALQELYDKYHDQGFEILDFPCNQFLRQAPGNGNEIHDFCTLRYHITFPQFAKIDVNGANEDPIFKFLKDNSPVRRGEAIKWNFTKFLLDKNGNVINRYEPKDKPDKLTREIEHLLNE